MRARDALVPGAIALAGAVVIVAAGLVTYGGRVSRFVHAGTFFVTPRPGLALQKGAGYDGQFLYRLALAPFDLRTTAHGITFDTPLRDQRIGLPLLAWLLSGGGHAAAVPWALLVLEVLSVAGIGAVGGLVAAGAGRAPAWGVLLASPAALQFAVLHDLTEPLEIALLAGGLLLWWSNRPVWAGVVLAGAVLTRETSLLLVAGVALAWLPRRSVPESFAWGLPVAAFVGWDGYVLVATGRLPVGQGSQDNLGPPLSGAVGLARDLPHAALHRWPLLAVQLLLVGYLLALVVPLLRTARPPLPAAWLLFAVLALCGSTVVWTGYDDLRFLVELWVVSVLVLLVSRVSLRWVGAGSLVVWVLSLAISRQ